MCATLQSVTSGLGTKKTRFVLFMRSKEMNAYCDYGLWNVASWARHDQHHLNLEFDDRYCSRSEDWSVPVDHMTYPGKQNSRQLFKCAPHPSHSFPGGPFSWLLFIFYKRCVLFKNTRKAQPDRSDPPGSEGGAAPRTRKHVRGVRWSRRRLHVQVCGGEAHHVSARNGRVEVGKSVRK